MLYIEHKLFTSVKEDMFWGMLICFLAIAPNLMNTSLLRFDLCVCVGRA